MANNKELDALAIRKKGIIKIAKHAEQHEYTQNFMPSEIFNKKLEANGIDIFTFIERKWCCPISNPPSAWRKTQDNVALLNIKSYDDWWEGIGKKTRNMVRKAEKSGVKLDVVEPSESLAEGIWKIYNETPIRQGRAFSHYGQALDNVKGIVLASKKDTFIGAYFNNELIGFIQLIYGDNVVIIGQILSLQKCWDKAVNNCLVAKAVEVCASNNNHWLMYGRIGNHPSLDKFKESNGFIKFALTRYYVPLTRKGGIAIKLGLHRELKDAVPQSVKNKLFGVYNWVSRTKTKLKLKKQIS